LVVIAIITILASLLMPALGKAKEVSRRGVCVSSEKQLVTASASYQSDNDGWYPCYVAASGNCTSYGWCNLFVTGDYAGGGRVKDSGLWADTTLHCPSRTPNDIKIDTWSDYVISQWVSGYGGVFSVSKGQRDSDVKTPSRLVLFAESWNQFLRYPSAGGRGLDNLGVSGSGQMPISNTSAAPDNCVTVSPWTHSVGSNYGMCDGSVSYVKAGDLRLDIFNIQGRSSTVGVDLTRMAK
jgi:prepilin-type processing-associated H-X9-DG protein